MVRNKIRIAIIGLGDSIHTVKIARRLAERGHQVHLIWRSTQRIDSVHCYDIRDLKDSRPRWKRIVTLSINSYRFRKIRMLFAIKQALRRISPDVLYSYTLLNSFPGYIGLCTGFHPLVVTPLNGDVLWAPDSIGKPGCLSFRQRLILKYAIKKASMLTASSCAMRDGWIKLGARPDFIRMIVDPGTDTELFSPGEKKNWVREKLQLNDKPVVLSTRSLGKFYNIDVIVQAIPAVLKKIPDTKFVFIWNAASPDQVSGLRSCAERLNVTKAAHFVGHVGNYRNELPAYYNMADVFVSLSAC
ncbi:glycosyltransferase family 4 protein, partial [Candidatus Omnitrophota bacterium]